MARNRLVLVIDDEAPIRRVIELKLKNSGYDVLLAVNGEEGLRIVENEKPGVVITDINMPKMSGKELCERTNALKEARPFLTIIMTARIMPNERVWVDTMRETVFMEKPFSPSRLVETINRYFEVHP